MSDWMMTGRQPAPQRSYDVMQVCLNGHRITDSARRFPEQRKDFCPDCGAKTIEACPRCNAPIPGFLNGGLSIRSARVPNHCASCGAPYPWREAQVAAAIEILQMQMEAADAAAVTELVPLIATEAPRTEVAAHKLRGLLSKLRKPAYDICIAVLTDLAAETAKKALGLGP